MIDDLIPIVLFLTIGGVFALAYYFRFRTRREVQTTLRAAIEQGQVLSPELIEGLADSLARRHADLRRGVVSIAMGLAVLAVAVLLGEEDAERPLLALASFPILLGIAYLGLWFFTDRGRRET